MQASAPAERYIFLAEMLHACCDVSCSVGLCLSVLMQGHGAACMDHAAAICACLRFSMHICMAHIGCVLKRLCRCADDTLEYDYFDDYDKIDTEPAGTGTGIFYAAVDVLTIQQVLAGPSHRPVDAQPLCCA